MRKQVRKGERVLFSIGVLMLLGMMFIGAFDVIGRYFFDHPLRGALEWSQLLMAGVALLAWGHVQGQKGHISVELIVQRYPGRSKKVIQALTLVLIVLFFGVMSWKSMGIALRVLQEGRNLEVVPLPQFPFRCFVPVGSAFFAAEALLQLIELTRSRGKADAL